MVPACDTEVGTARSTIAPPAMRPAASVLTCTLLPLALVAGSYYYVTGGQVMETDNAYVQAATVGVSTDVAGTVVEIDVTNNQVVQKGQVTSISTTANAGGFACACSVCIAAPPIAAPAMSAIASPNFECMNCPFFTLVLTGKA